MQYMLPTQERETNRLHLPTTAIPFRSPGLLHPGGKCGPNPTQVPISTQDIYIKKPRILRTLTVPVREIYEKTRAQAVTLLPIPIFY